MVTWTFGFDPIIAQLGPFQLGWHGIFTAVAVVVAIWLAGYLGVRRGIPQDIVYGVAGWGVVGGIVGARLFHVADHLDFYLANPMLIPMVWEGGIAVYGAFIGGIIGGGVAAWRDHLDPWPLLDIAAPSMLVGQAIGRLGCLSNGDAWGSDATGCPSLCGSSLHQSERPAARGPERRADVRLPGLRDRRRADPAGHPVAAARLAARAPRHDLSGCVRLAMRSSASA